MKEKGIWWCNHIIIILSATFITFMILQYYNVKMDFLTNAFSIRLLGGYCLLSMINSVSLLIGQVRKSGCTGVE